MASRRAIITIMIITTIAIAIGSWNAISDEIQIFDKETIERTVTFDNKKCSYGYAYIERDNRTPSVADWMRINGASDGKRYYSTDKQNQPTITVEIQIPEITNKETKYAKITYEDLINESKISKTIKFKT